MNLQISSAHSKAREPYLQHNSSIQGSVNYPIIGNSVEWSAIEGVNRWVRAESIGNRPFYRSFIVPICCKSCMVLSMFFRLVLTNSLFSLRDINLTLGLLPPRRHVVWRDSVGVKSSVSGLKIRVRGYFSSELSLVVAPY